MKTPINTTSCYLNPGDRLHAKVKYLNPNSTIYRLAEYRIMEYDADGIVKNESIQEVKDGGGNKCSLGNAGTWSVNDNSVDGNTAQI